MLVADGYGDPRQLFRRLTFRQFSGYLNAAGKRRHTGAAFQWQLAMAHVVAAGGKPQDFPDYVGSEEEYDPEWIERQLSRHPLVRRVDNTAPTN